MNEYNADLFFLQAATQASLTWALDTYNVSTPSLRTATYTYFSWTLTDVFLHLTIHQAVNIHRQALAAADEEDVESVMEADQTMQSEAVVADADPEQDEARPIEEVSPSTAEWNAERNADKCNVGHHHERAWSSASWDSTQWYSP